jgi:hypothetical protein
MNRSTLEPRTGDVATVADLEADIEAALSYLRELDGRGALPRELRPMLMLAPPEGTSVHVSLRERDGGRHLRPSAPARVFSHRHCAAWIVYEAPQVFTDDPQAARQALASALDEFVVALDQAEHEPHLHFVSLKWFRDTYLFKRGFAWARDPEIPRRLIQHATEGALILTSKVPNPKAPDFPVTSIRLDRAHPEVVRILGARPEAQPEQSRETDQ